MLKPRPCKVCGREYRPTGSAQRTCDEACQVVDRRRQRAVRGGGSVPELMVAVTFEEAEEVDELTPEELAAYDALVGDAKVTVERDDRSASGIRTDIRLGMLMPLVLAETEEDRERVAQGLDSLPCGCVRPLGSDPAKPCEPHRWASSPQTLARAAPGA
jgi:hypothetical protein